MICCVNCVECFVIYVYCYYVCDVGICVCGFQLEESYVIFVCVPSAKEIDHLLPWPNWPVCFHYLVHWC